MLRVVTTQAPWHEYSSYIARIIFSEGLTNIGDFAFEDCYNLTALDLPHSIVNIGEGAFQFCPDLKYISNIASWCDINFGNDSSNPLYRADSLYIDNVFIQELIIPEGISQIKDYAFYRCPFITTIIIPNTVTSIGKESFVFCEEVSSLTIGSGVASIGNNAFRQCDNLNKITIYAPIPPTGGIGRLSI